MTDPRPHPFDLVFGTFRERHFPAIRQELGDHTTLADFLLAGAALEMMRDLRPDPGLGDAIDDFVALIHAAYRFWQDGEKTVVIDADATRRLCAPDVDQRAPSVGPSGTTYIQIAPRLVWVQVDGSGPFEPLDGWFDVPADALRVVACCGVHADRPGLSVIAVEGNVPADVRRPDGSLPFAPLMPGGDLAGLHALATTDELLLLAARARASEETAGWR